MPEAHTLEEKIKNARSQLDAHIREIVRWHFSPDTGTPFWLEKAKTFKFNPLTDVNGWDDIKKFPFFEDDWLRGGPVRRWVPRAYADRGVYVFETGGTTGVPKSRVVIDDFKIDYEMFSDTLPEKFFPQGSNWLMLGPSRSTTTTRWRSNTCRNTGEGSVFASISIRDGWSKSSRKAGWNTSRHTRSTASIRP